MNILIIYSSTTTYTSTVFEHLNSFAHHSRHRIFYCDQDKALPIDIQWYDYDAIVLHYSVRLPFDHISDSTAKALTRYTGLKILFIQDEYDHTYRTWYWIKKLGIQLVFTVVPQEGIESVYPSEEFPGVRFVSNLTGYVPEALPEDGTILPPSKRELIVGYRGRQLPIRYGQLGQEKSEIGRMVKQYCKSKGIRHNIDWTEDARIYGQKWYEFMSSCRATLGTESGSNVFDWDGTLASRIEAFRHSKRNATDEEIYRAVIEPLEVPGIMNQVSPRIFEAITFRTVLVLYEGNYSDVVMPERHFIPLKKDGSNLEEVFALLQNGKLVDEMAERAYQDIIASGKYSYQAFVRMVDEQISLSSDVLNSKLKTGTFFTLSNKERNNSILTSSPRRANAPKALRDIPFPIRLVYILWRRLPEHIRVKLKQRLRLPLGKDDG